MLNEVFAKNPWLVHIVGGSAVLATYAICLPVAMALPNGMMRAWAGIRGNVRALYGVSIVLAAIAYATLAAAARDRQRCARCLFWAVPCQGAVLAARNGVAGLAVRWTRRHDACAVHHVGRRRHASACEPTIAGGRMAALPCAGAGQHRVGRAVHHELSTQLNTITHSPTTHCHPRELMHRHIEAAYEKTKSIADGKVADHSRS